MILDKRDLMNRKFIFLNDPDDLYVELNQVFNIDLNSVNAENLKRYCTKLFYDKNVPVDYNKVIRIALAEYLKKHIKDKDLKGIEEMKAEEEEQIEKARKKDNPKFDWDLSNKNKKGKSNGIK